MINSFNNKNVQFVKNLKQGPSSTEANDKFKGVTNEMIEKKDGEKIKALYAVFAELLYLFKYITPNRIRLSSIALMTPRAQVSLRRSK